MVLAIGSTDGAVALAEGLKCCTNLQTLNLSSNSIGSDGAVALAEGLKCCTNLQTLDLSLRFQQYWFRWCSGSS